MIGHEDLVAILRAIAEPTRLRLVNLLARSELTVTDLISILNQSQPRISRHLKLMADSGVLSRNREGTRAFYRLAQSPQTVKLLQDILNDIDAEDPVFARDWRKLEDIREARARSAEAYFSANAERWDEIRTLHLAEEDVEQNILKQLGDTRFTTMLDLGTGTGRMLEVFSDRYNHGVGIDTSADMLAVARAKLEENGIGHAEVRLGDLFDLSEYRGNCDLVMIHMVLHFLEEPGLAVEEAARCLTDDGRLLIVDFAPHDFEFLRAAHSHVRNGFSREDMEGFSASAGLKIASVTDLTTDDVVEPALTVSVWELRR